MAKIDTYSSSGQLTTAPLATSRGMSNSLNALLAKGHNILDEQAAEEGYREGIEQQANNTNLELENGWTISSKARDKGRKLAFGATKKRELDDAAAQLKHDNALNPESFKENYAKFRTKFMQGIPTELQPSYGMMVDDTGAKTQLQIQTATETHNSRVEGQIVVDELSRLESELFNLGQSDPDSDEVQEKLTEFMMVLHEAGATTRDGGPVISPEQAGAYGRSIKQTVRRAEIVHGFEQANDKEAYIKSIETGNYDGDKLNEASTNNVLSEMNRRYRRIETEMNTELRVLGKQANKAIEAFKDGDIPANYEGLLTAIDNAKHPESQLIAAKLEIYENIQSTMADYRERSLPEQQFMIGQINKIIQEKGWTEERDTLRESMEQTHSKLVTATKNGDLLSYAETTGAVDTTPFDIDSPDTWEQRRNATEEATTMLKSRVAPLKPEEIEQITDEYESASAQRQEQIEDNLIAFTEGDQDDLQAVLSQMWPKNPSAAISFGLRHTPDLTKNKQATTAARLIREGQALIKNNPKIITETSKVRSKIQEFVAPLFTSEDGQISIDVGGNARNGLSDAIFNAYVKMMDKNGRSGEDLNTATLKGAVGMVVGSQSENFPSFNGGSFLPFQYGMTNRDVRDRIDILTKDDFKKAGGSMPTAISGTRTDEVTLEKIKDDARFVSISPSRYQIWISRAGGGYRPLQNEDGHNYIFDYDKISKDLDRRIIGGN